MDIEGRLPRRADRQDETARRARRGFVARCALEAAHGRSADGRPDGLGDGTPTSDILRHCTAGSFIGKGDRSPRSDAPLCSGVCSAFRQGGGDQLPSRALDPPMRFLEMVVDAGASVSNRHGSPRGGQLEWQTVGLCACAEAASDGDRIVNTVAGGTLLEWTASHAAEPRMRRPGAEGAMSGVRSRG